MFFKRYIERFPRVVRQLLHMLGQGLVMLAVWWVASLGMDFWRGNSVATDVAATPSLMTVQGDLVDLAQMSQASIVAVYVWASWCGPCQLTTPAIEKLSHDLPIVSIAFLSGNDQEVLAHASKRLFSTLVVNDPEGKLAAHMGVVVTPSVLFIKDAKVVGYTCGVSSYWGLWLRAKWLGFRA